MMKSHFLQAAYPNNPYTIQRRYSVKPPTPRSETNDDIGLPKEQPINTETRFVIITWCYFVSLVGSSNEADWLENLESTRCNMDREGIWTW